MEYYGLDILDCPVFDCDSEYLTETSELIQVARRLHRAEPQQGCFSVN